MEKVVLLADPNSNWEFANKIKNYIEQTHGGAVPLDEVSIEKFGNGELNMHLPNNIRRKEVYFIHDSSKDPSQWWIEMLLIKDLCLSSSAESLSFVLPDYLYGRKDQKEKSRVPISARAVARSISPGLSRIITMDLHAGQIQGFFPEEVPVDALRSFPSVVEYLEKNPEEIEDLTELVIVSPDSGGTKRVRSFAKRIGSKYPIAVMDKVRKKDEEVDKTRLIGDVKNKDVFMVDDIFSTGGTIIKSIPVLKKRDAKKIYAYATHGLFLNGTKELTKSLDRVLTSNTHKQEDNGLEVIDVTPVFGEAIYRAQKGLSISRLFE